MSSPVDQAPAMGATGSSGPGAVPAYDVRGLHFYYGRSREQDVRWVIRDVSLEIASGEILGIVGPNGSGKTSLLKLLAKLAVPQQGDIALFGACFTRLSQAKTAQMVAFVPQESAQMFPFTVAETVLMGRFPHRRRTRWNVGFGWENREDCASAAQAMATMDIGQLAARAVTDLSGGERQRTMIARALAQSPRVLLLDEPTAFLDLHHQIEICSVLRRLTDGQGLTVVVVSHDLNLASQYCDRVVMLKEGQVRAVGVPSQVMSVDILREVYCCDVLVDLHPESGLPRITLPRRLTLSTF